MDRRRDEWVTIKRMRVTLVLTMPEAIRHPNNVGRSAHVEVDGIVLPAVAPRFYHHVGAIRPSLVISASEALLIFAAGLGEACLEIDGG